MNCQTSQENASLNSENFHQSENIDIDYGPALTQTHQLLKRSHWSLLMIRYLYLPCYIKEDDKLRWEDETLSMCLVTLWKKDREGTDSGNSFSGPAFDLRSDDSVRSLPMRKCCKEVSVVWIHTAATHTFETKMLWCRGKAMSSQASSDDRHSEQGTLSQWRNRQLWKRTVGVLSCDNVSLSPTEAPGQTAGQSNRRERSQSSSELVMFPRWVSADQRELPAAWQVDLCSGGNWVSRVKRNPAQQV